MAYDIGTRISFLKRAAQEQRQRLYDVGTRIVFVKATADDGFSVPVA